MFEELDKILEKMGVDTLKDILILEALPEKGKELSYEELKKYLRYQINGALKIEGWASLPVLHIPNKGTSYNSIKNKVYSLFQNNRSNNKHKFHILWCITLRDMFENKKGNRYIVVPAKDKVLDHIFKYEDTDQELEICQNCLNMLSSDWNINKNKENFKLKEIIGKYEPKYKQLPASDWLIPREKGYPKSWKTISKQYRKYKQWKCEICNIDCSKDNDLLDAHHIDGNAHNITNNNLQALCKVCHSKEYQHAHYKPTEEHVERIKLLRT